MTLLNIHESKRWAFRFWVCLPVYQPEAATNAGATTSQVQYIHCIRNKKVRRGGRTTPRGAPAQPTTHSHAPARPPFDTLPTQREIVEGSEGEIRAAFFVFAVTREVDAATGALVWRIVEMSMQGSMLYL